MAGSDDGTGMARGEQSRRKKCAVGKPGDLSRTGIRAEENPIRAIGCRARHFRDQLANIGFVEPHVIVNAGTGITDRELPARRRARSTWLEKFHDDIVEML